MVLKIGFVTIGQSPREDVVPDIAEILGPEVEVVQAGALDGLSREDIKAIHPESGDFRLITRLRNGHPAVVGKKKIVPLLRRSIRELARQNVRLIALLCTDEFPRIGQGTRGRPVVLQPSRLLVREAVRLHKKGKLGVFVPLEEQKVETRRKWKKTGLRVVVEALNPYLETGASNVAVDKMRDERVDLIVLDCIGYGRETRDKIRRVLGKPVLLPRVLLASAIERVIAGDHQNKGWPG